MKVRGLKAVCKKCGLTVKLDTGNLTKEDALERLAARQGFNCSAGMHVEIGRMIDYLEILSEDIEDLGDSKSDDEFYKELVDVCGTDNVFTTQQLPLGLEHCGSGYFKDAQYNYDREDSPCGGRFYIRRKRS